MFNAFGDVIGNMQLWPICSCGLYNYGLGCASEVCSDACLARCSDMDYIFYGQYIYGLNHHDLNGYGLNSYGLYSYGLNGHDLIIVMAYIVMA